MKLQRTRTLVLLALAALPLAAQHGLSKIGDASRLPANVRPPQLIGVGVDEHLGSSVDMNLTFTGKLGISYQRQRSTNLSSWTDEGAAVIPGDATTTVTVPAPAGPQFWRFKVNY